MNKNCIAPKQLIIKVYGLILIFQLRYAFKFLCIFIIIISCTENKQSPKISFYHWKTEFSIDSAETNYLNTLNVEKLYLRIFDVKWVESEKKAFPFAIFKWNQPDSEIIKSIVPVIFITNESLQNTPSDKIEELVSNICNKAVSVISVIDKTKYKINEIQLDCDWTLQTKEKYFKIIEILKEKFSECKISATIRLHQVKYFVKTGVPPADKGVLMFYNMGKVDDNNEINSILNLETVKKYLVNFDKYPLKLDVALPLFSWGVHFRNKKIIQLINDLEESSIGDNLAIEKLEGNLYRVKQSHFFNGTYLYEGDEIRLEQTDCTELTKALHLINEHISNKDYEIIFYHLDKRVIRDFPIKKIIETIQN